MQNNKSKFLGMPHGTANGKLRKSILFSFVQRCDEDICYRCGEKINSVEELSIEHKQRWENVSVELFWDLDNIAFSHLKCNRPHVYNPSNKIVRPNTNVDWCSVHKTFHDKDAFCKSHRGQCREGNKLRMRTARDLDKNYGRKKVA